LYFDLGETWRDLRRMRLALSLALLSGCFSDQGTTIDGAAYSHACVTVLDCVPVVVGRIGCCGDCPNDVINQAEVARYMKAIAGRKAMCGPMPCLPQDSCATNRVVCQNSLCALGPSLDASTTD
jgi:hypothetical protein